MARIMPARPGRIIAFRDRFPVKIFYWYTHINWCAYTQLTSNYTHHEIANDTSCPKNQKSHNNIFVWTITTHIVLNKIQKFTINQVNLFCPVFVHKVQISIKRYQYLNRDWLFGSLKIRTVPGGSEVNFISTQIYKSINISQWIFIKLSKTQSFSK